MFGSSQEYAGGGVGEELLAVDSVGFPHLQVMPKG
jgi:hypothetical protein